MKRQLHRFKKLFFAAAIFCAVFLFQSCETTQPVLDESSERIVSPPYWAPAYDNVEQVHYYYLPDLETYYDVWASEFAYLDGGHWIFSPFLPPMYTSYDLRSAPVVILDYRVHEPWNYHELYVSHYPRYYFQTVPIGTDLVRPRGLDENVNKPVFYGPREASSNNTEPKKSLPLISTSPSMVSPNKIQPAKYSGKVTGHPVKVEKKMMKPKENAKKTSETKEPKKSKSAAKPKPQVSNYKELPIEKR
jgi:hypothetical protein